MWQTLCDDAHEAHALTVIHRAVLVIAVVFFGVGTYVVTTRGGAAAPPDSVAYGTAPAPAMGD
jgi:hypothetical protein